MFAANGRETILRDMGPGRLVGEMSAISAMPRSASVTAVEDSSLGMLSGAGFRAFMQEEPGAGYWMAVQLAARVRNLTEKARDLATLRSEEHTSELQSLMRISYAVFCLNKKKHHKSTTISY